MGKHSAPKTQSNKKKAALAVTAVALGAGALVISGGTANAASVNDWNKIAACESGDQNVPNSGNWSISYGDADSTGGLQIQTRTWNEYKSGISTAPAAYLATTQQQIQVAEKILADPNQGYAQAWVCNQPGHGIASGALSSSYGASNTSMYRGGVNPYASTPSTPVTPSPTPAPSTGTGMTPHAATAIAWAKQYADGGSKARTLSYSQTNRNGPYSYDCSSFLNAAWHAAGVTIPDDTESQRLGMTHVSLSTIRPGDLVLWYFDGTNQPDQPTNHVSMYIGGGQTIEMHSRTPNNVTIDSLASRQQSGRIVAIARPEPNVQPSTPAPTPTPVPVTPTPAPKPKPSSSDKTYKVVPGDYLYKLAKHFYNDGSKWHTIYNANRSVIGGDPNLILPGQMLTIPGVKA